MKKSGLADSPFFHVPAMQRETSLPDAPEPSTKQPGARPARAISSSMEPAADQALKAGEAKPNRKGGKQVSQPANSSSDRDTMPPRHHESVVSRYHATTVEQLRAAVKRFGKEAATHRFTPEEKKAIADILYTYKTQGIRTSENEITRIAVNFVAADYEENGENSLLDQVIKALNG